MKVEEIEVEMLPPPPRGDTEFSRLLALVLDDLIPIPGTKFRIGLDPLIGLIPGIGDASGTAMSSLILVHALRLGVPRVVIARMAANVLVNALVGAVPGVGDVFSAWFKSNRRNYALLNRHSGGKRVSTAGDWVFLGMILGFVVVVGLVVALASAYLAWRMLSLLFG